MFRPRFFSALRSRTPTSFPRLRRVTLPSKSRRDSGRRCSSSNLSGKPPPPPPPPSSSASSRSSPQSRADRILSRLPASMQRYTTRLRNAPVSHVVAFLALHELTAIVPLFALFGVFHYTDYVPLGYMMENYGDYVRNGVGRFERYFRRKGWFGFGQDGEAEEEQKQVVEEGRDDDAVIMDRWNSADGKYKIVVEVALAYAITKVLLPVRIVGSLWATPWFAGLFARIRRAVPIGTRK